MKSYTTSNVVARDPITFVLDDDEYEFLPPKSAVLLMALVGEGNDGVGRVAAMMHWLEAGLDDVDYARLRGRLEDPDDGLDFDVVGEIVKDLIADSTGRPTSRPSA